MDHYFSDKPSSEHSIREIEVFFASHNFRFLTDSGVFSKGSLDKGTRLLLESIPPLCDEKVLDLGCGWGAIGVIISGMYPQSRVYMTDINPRAVALSKKNAKRNNVSVTVQSSDSFTMVDENFDIILTNPPIRAGKKVVYKMVDDSYHHLTDGGRFYAVVRTKQGANSYRDKLDEVFGSSEIVKRGSGYKVFKAIKDEGNKGS